MVEGATEGRDWCLGECDGYMGRCTRQQEANEAAIECADDRGSRRCRCRRIVLCPDDYVSRDMPRVELH